MNLNALLSSILGTIEIAVKDNQWHIANRASKEVLTPDQFKNELYRMYCNDYSYKGTAVSLKELIDADYTLQHSHAGWKILSWNDQLDIKAEKNNVNLVFGAQDYELVKTLNAGEYINVKKRKPWYDIHSPFIYFFSDVPYDNEISTQVRIYLNAAPSQSARLIRLVAKTLNEYHIPFNVKTLYKFSEKLRSDNTVLYISQRHISAAWIAFSIVMDELRTCLHESNPLFTKPLGKGISFAESPMDNPSFGIKVATLLFHSFTEVMSLDIHAAEWELAFNKRLKEEGYMNHGEMDIYRNKHTQYPYAFHLLEF